MMHALGGNRGALILSVLLAACSSGPLPASAPPSVPPSVVPSLAAATGTAESGGLPTQASARSPDGSFELTLRAERDRYRSDEAIAIAATWTYLGPAETIEITGSGGGIVGFGLREIGGRRQLQAARTADCRIYRFTRGQPTAQPYVKSGGFSPDTDPDAAFWADFFKDGELRLPAGRWEISAVADYLGAGCTLPSVTVTASVTLTID